jgi:hypothetical protein
MPEKQRNGTLCKITITETTTRSEEIQHGRWGWGKGKNYVLVVYF